MNVKSNVMLTFQANSASSQFLPPCQLACPVGENIQRTHVMMSTLPRDPEKAKGKIIDIGNEIYEKNPFFAVCGYICGLCEEECNYTKMTGAIRRTMLKRFIGKYYIPYLDEKPAMPIPSGKKIAIAGGGPSGLMCAYYLGKKGYKVTIFEESDQCGGALRLIPKYRLPDRILNSSVNNLIRISQVEVEYNAALGQDATSIDELFSHGYQAVFIALGTPISRPLTFEDQPVPGSNSTGVIAGTRLLDPQKRGIDHKIFNGKRAIVIGGGNTAFDVARTVKRFGAEVKLLCLECADRTTVDGIPAKDAEIEDAQEEGVEVIFSRGVQEIMTINGHFSGLLAPRCTSVFGPNGFAPQFDCSNTMAIEADYLLVTVGQIMNTEPLALENLLNERGKADIDPLTLMSNRREGVFVGGDVRRPGYAAEAMRDGIIAAESIDRYLSGKPLRTQICQIYNPSMIPQIQNYELQPEIQKTPPVERLNFNLYEEDFTLEKAVEESARCLCCGPCEGCKACIDLGIIEEIAAVDVISEICCACGICTMVCPYDAAKLSDFNNNLVSVPDQINCKGCGVCVSACPAQARTINDNLMAKVESIYFPD